MVLAGYNVQVKPSVAVGAVPETVEKFQVPPVGVTGCVLALV